MKPTEGGDETTLKRSTTTTGNTSESTAAGQDTQSTQMSVNSAGQSSGSKEHWQKPTTIKELAANINTVANHVLNGTIDLRTAQVYGSLVRVVAQATSLEVTRGRFLKEMPDLNLDLKDVDD